MRLHSKKFKETRQSFQNNQHFLQLGPIQLPDSLSLQRGEKSVKLGVQNPTTLTALGRLNSPCSSGSHWQQGDKSITEADSGGKELGLEETLGEFAALLGDAPQKGGYHHLGLPFATRAPLCDSCSLSHWLCREVRW